MGRRARSTRVVPPSPPDNTPHHQTQREEKLRDLNALLLKQIVSLREQLHSLRDALASAQQHRDEHYNLSLHLQRKFTADMEDKESCIRQLQLQVARLGDELGSLKCELLNPSRERDEMYPSLPNLLQEGVDKRVGKDQCERVTDVVHGTFEVHATNLQHPLTDREANHSEKIENHLVRRLGDELGSLKCELLNPSRERDEMYLSLPNLLQEGADKKVGKDQCERVTDVVHGTVEVPATNPQHLLTDREANHSEKIEKHLVTGNGPIEEAMVVVQVLQNKTSGLMRSMFTGDLIVDNDEYKASGRLSCSHNTSAK